MISYLKEQIDKILAYLFKVERRTLLWTNPSPTSVFNAQTISLDLSDYDAVDVEFRHWTNKDCRVTTRNYLNEGEGVGIGISTDAASYGNFRRGFKMHTNGVQFWGGTSNANVDNNSTIPVRIWGVKSGGVLRNPVIAVLSAISKIGGGIDESSRERAFFQTSEKSKHSIISRAGGAYVLRSVDLGYSGRSNRLRPSVYFYSNMGNNKHFGLQKLCVLCASRTVDYSVHKLANKRWGCWTKLYDASECNSHRALTISERRRAA